MNNLMSLPLAIDLVWSIGGGVILLVIIGVIAMFSKWYVKPQQGTVLVRTGSSLKVSKSGMMVVPVLHRLEVMDISLKSLMISRYGKDGLVCKDNMRADIKVTFFIKVNPEETEIAVVAQSIGCQRASDPAALMQLFDAKFSDALKTVGKQFDFVELYEKRDEFRAKITNLIREDLNGYKLEDAAIDYLEQTPIDAMDERNILDAEGIKKITELTANQKIMSNSIDRNKEKTIKQQDVEAREAILEMEKQLAESEEKQKREIAIAVAREGAETHKVQEEERLKGENARLATEEELEIREQNKQRQVIVAEKSKERTEAVETERVEKDRLLEVNERERVVTLANIEKEKAIEEERKNIQEVIRERVAIEKTVVDEEEIIKDTKAFAEADRIKRVAITDAERIAEEQLVQQIKQAEASKEAAEFDAMKKLIEAEASQAAAGKEAEAIKILADAEATRQSAVGLGEAKVIEAKAEAAQKKGDSDAHIIEAAAEAQAKGIELKAEAQSSADRKLGQAAADVEKQKGLAHAEVTEAQALANAKGIEAEATAQAHGIEAKAAAEGQYGEMEATVLHQKMSAEAKGIEEKAEAMLKLDGVGKEHEEFKLQLDKEKAIELAQIDIQTDIAKAQAEVLGEALRSAKIDIVGGEAQFFDRITNAITSGKTVDRFIDNSATATEVRNQLLDKSDGSNLLEKIGKVIGDSNVSSEDLKNLSISALIFKLTKATEDPGRKGLLEHLLTMAKNTGLADVTPASLGLKKGS
jgi:uncharacterized membrane protein YqiK